MMAPVLAGAARAATVLVSCLAFVPASRAEGDPVQGATAFRTCLPCHALEAGRHKSGPNLAGIYGRPAGKAAGFDRYSHPLAQAAFDWTPEKLDAWLANPGAVVPGNRMTYLVADPNVRANLIAYLKALSEGKTEGLAIPKETVLDLKTLGRAGRVAAIRQCHDTFHVTLENGVTIPFWERNLRLRVDSTDEGPAPGVPAMLPGGMQGDRYTVVFHAPAEISSFIQSACTNE